MKNALSSISPSPVRRFVNWLTVWLPIQERRKQLSREVYAAFDATIAYGPFKGQKLPRNSWWGLKDRASMILGMYEQEVLESLMNLPRRYAVFIELGAADGYYAVGALASGRFRHAHCFEMSKRGQQVIRDNARLNGVLEKVTVHGKADAGFYALIPESERNDSVLFIDIEGGEFDLCTPELFERFRTSVIFIEIHALFFPDGQARYEKLKLAAKTRFHVTEMTTGARDPSRIPELDGYEDTDRWLICSEGRKKRMAWIRLDPIEPDS